MKINIKNVGILHEAEVNISGLTIIAGENDTGKSTVGKVLFSIIKGVNNTDKAFKENKFSKIENIFEEIYFLYRKNINPMVSNNSLEIAFEALQQINPARLKRDLIRNIQLDDVSILKKFIFSYRKKLDYLVETDFFDVDLTSARLNNLQKLDQILDEISKPDEYIIESVVTALNSEFAYDINSKGTSEKAEITYTENNETIFHLLINENTPRMGLVSHTPMELQDATLVESPFVFQMFRMISEMNIFESREMNSKSTNFHIKDLINKMSDSSYYDSSEKAKNTKLIEKINEIISGESFFDIEKDDFYFKRSIDNSYHSFATSNVASGIKSFGIIQMLLKSNVLNERSILILDEPEIHLHPKWQVIYCEIIATLVASGVKVLINTHSPYIIQALKVCSAKLDIENKTNYYLAEEIEGSHLRTITNANNNLNKIFKKLSDPIQKLVWGKGV